MNYEIRTYSALFDMVDNDTKDHNLKGIAVLFLSAMNDWPTQDQHRIEDFISELKEYFGDPITIEK